MSFCEVERARLGELDKHRLLDTAPEPCFNGIVKMAAAVFGVPTVLISLVGADRQWFKARVGLDTEETPRDISFCTHAIEQDGIYEVVDALQSPKFSRNPLVTGAPHIRYYAGIPLRVPGGHALGTLCLIDYAPRPPLSGAQRQLLEQMRDQVVELMELRQLRHVGRVSSLIADTISDALVVADADGIIRKWNSGAATMFGWSAEEAEGQSVSLIMPDRLKDARSDILHRVASGGGPHLAGKVIELTAKRRSGVEFPIEIALGRWTKEGTDRTAGFAAIIRDISDRKRLESERRRARVFLDEVVENLPAMLFVKNAETREYEFLNRAGEEVIGRPRDEIIGHTDEELFPELADGYVRRDDQVLATGKMFTFESDFENDRGEVRRMRTKRVLVQRDDQDPFILGISEDVTERHRAEQQLAHLALNDPLTGLRNRAGIERDFGQFSRRLGDEPAALISIDLDGFKAVNDGHGHAAGDGVLAEVAARVHALLPPRSVAARIGGDEFLVLSPGKNAGNRAANLARAIVKRLAEPYEMNGHFVTLGASVGVALLPADGEDFAVGCRSADRALYRAKETGRSRYCFFDPSMDEAAAQRRALEADLRAALERGELELNFQPLASLATGRIEGFEALARWTHPERGPIPPDVFIPIAEESGLIVDLGAWVLEQAVREAASWAPPLRIAVNLSPGQFQDARLVAKLGDLLAETGMDPARLELEITETMLIGDTAEALAVLRALRGLGVRIAIDDFGTGYSSLSYFRLFPFDKVKIDRSFVGEMTSSPQALAIVQAVIGLGRGLGLPVVAEGVETDEQLGALRAEGCDIVQGFHIGRPQPIANFEKVVLAQRGPLLPHPAQAANG